MFGRSARGRAQKVLEAALKADESGDVDDALRLYAEACELDPTWSAPWFNRGLILKHAGRWEESFDCNRRSAELNPKDEASWWNLGIAATALGRWEAARHAWRAYGIEVPDGEGPVEMNLGTVPIRINASTDGEVVWCRRIDPARAIIQNIPLPESGHRYGDLVLHDGAPAGERVVNGRTYPVFNALTLLKESDFATFRFRAWADSEEAIEALEALADEQGLASEDWGKIRNLCRECSAGVAVADHEHPSSDEAEDGAHDIGIAAKTRREATGLMQRWAEGAADRRFERSDPTNLAS